jgi:hypothetical protein
MPAVTVSHSALQQIGIRSIVGLWGSLVPLIGVTTAFAAAITLDAYGSEIFHCALGAGPFCWLSQP